MEIKELIFKIKRKIMEYESKMNSYYVLEREHLDKIQTYNDYINNTKFDFNLIDLIYAGIILNNKKEAIQILQDSEDDIKDFIEKIDSTVLEMCFKIAYSNIDSNEIEKINSDFKKDFEYNPEKADETIKESKKFFEVIKNIDQKDAFVIYSFYTANEVCKNDFSMDVKYIRDFFSTLEFNKKWLDFFDRIETKKKEIKLENKRLNKLYSDRITKLNRLINNLEKGKNGEEITNIDELLDYAGEEFRHDILIYIKENNKTYN